MKKKLYLTFGSLELIKCLCHQGQGLTRPTSLFQRYYTIAFFTGNIVLCQILTDVAFKTLTTVPIMSNIIYNGVIGRGFFGLIS